MYRPSARRSLVGAVTLLVALGLSIPASTAAPDRINKAPSLPALPTPDRAELGVDTARSIPAAGSSAQGMWITLSQGAAGNSRTRIKMPVLEGSPLMADWNGDGVATPGVFSGGQWFITNAAIGRSTWEGFRQGFTRMPTAPCWNILRLPMRSLCLIPCSS